MKKTAAVMALIAIMIMTLCACGNDSGQTADNETYIVDGISYSLGSEWVYDDEGKSFSVPSSKWATYSIADGEDLNCSSAADRLATFPPDGSDGIDKETIEINGTDALLTAEPVNEIMYYQVYFYADGQEHMFSYEMPFEENPIEKYTIEFMDSISW